MGDILTENSTNEFSVEKLKEGLEPIDDTMMALLTSVPYWGFLISDMGNTWGINIFRSNGPTYLKYMLGTDIFK